MSEGQTNQEAQMKTCIACGLAIPIAATLCSHCSHHQSRWRNSLHYFASISGILVVFLTLATYIVSTFPEIRKMIHWRDNVLLTAFYSEGHVALGNGSDGPVFLSRIDVSVLYDGEKAWTFMVPINEQLDRNKFLSFEYRNPHKDNGDSQFLQMEDKSNEVSYLYSSIHDDDKCFEMAILYVNDPKYVQVSSFLEHLYVYRNVEASLTYYNERGEKVEQDYELVATILHSKSPECR